MVIFHSYVSLPEGKETTTIWPYGTSATILRKIFWENCVSAIAAKTPKNILAFEDISIWKRWSTMGLNGSPCVLYFQTKPKTPAVNLVDLNFEFSMTDWPLKWGNQTTNIPLERAYNSISVALGKSYIILFPNPKKSAAFFGVVFNIYTNINIK